MALKKIKMELRFSDIRRDRWISLLCAHLAGRPGEIMTHLDVHDEDPFDNVVYILLSQAGVNPCLVWEQIQFPDFNDFIKKTPEALYHTIRQKLVRMHTSELSVAQLELKDTCCNSFNVWSHLSEEEFQTCHQVDA